MPRFLIFNNLSAAGAGWKIQEIAERTGQPPAPSSSSQRADRGANGQDRRLGEIVERKEAAADQHGRYATEGMFFWKFALEVNNGDIVFPFPFVFVSLQIRYLYTYTYTFFYVKLFFINDNLAVSEKAITFCLNRIFRSVFTVNLDVCCLNFPEIGNKINFRDVWIFRWCKD